MNMNEIINKINHDVNKKNWNEIRSILVYLSELLMYKKDCIRIYFNFEA